MKIHKRIVMDIYKYSVKYKDRHLSRFFETKIMARSLTDVKMKFVARGYGKLQDIVDIEEVKI